MDKNQKACDPEADFHPATADTPPEPALISQPRTSCSEIRQIRTLDALSVQPLRLRPPSPRLNTPTMSDAVVANVEYSKKENVNYTMVRRLLSAIRERVGG